MTSKIQSLIDSGANVILQISVYDLKSFACELLSQSNNSIKEVSEKEMYYTASEVSKMLHVDKSTLWRWSKSGYLSPIELGGKRLYRQSDINSLMGGR